MILTALLNGLFGVICGLRFRVLILAPLTVVALGEIFFLKTPNDTWSSISLSTIVLIFSIEIGYFGGAILSSFRLLSDRSPLRRKCNKISLTGLGL
jgi:hypothetical protein